MLMGKVENDATEYEASEDEGADDPHYLGVYSGSDTDDEAEEANGSEDLLKAME